MGKSWGATVESNMVPTEPPRLAAQMNFLLAADGLKTVARGNHIADGSRNENSAEHSWHVALMAMVLAEYCPDPIDLGHVLKLLIVHDLVEVYAGDTQIYNDEAVIGQADREARAAQMIFGLLQDDQELTFKELWREFEEDQTAEAGFARAIDALAPTWLHWGDHSTARAEPLDSQKILALKASRLERYPALWEMMQQVVRSARQRGMIK